MRRIRRLIGLCEEYYEEPSGRIKKDGGIVRRMEHEEPS